MRPHLVRINSTIVEQLPLVFNVLLILEITVCLVILLLAPLLCVAVSRVGTIHRNFRCQACLSALLYCLGICARFFLIYYQINDLALTDDDQPLLFAELIRDSVIGYYCALAAAYEYQTLIATYYWKWYEKNSLSTIVVLIISEIVNCSLAFSNAAMWLCGYADVLFNILYLLVISTISVLGFFFTYRINLKHLAKISKGHFSFNSYTVGRSFQIRENVLLMQYNLRIMVPAIVVGLPGFACFAYTTYGPEECLISRSIAYATFDFLFALSRLAYTSREIRKHPGVWREFKNIGIIRRFRLTNNGAREESTIVTKLDLSTTQTYFDQFRSAWA